MKTIPDKINGTTTLDAPSEFNPLKNELINAILDTGQALETSTNINKQIQIAMAIYAAGSSFYTDSGSAGAYVLSPVGKQAPHAYFNGMLVRFRPNATNAGVATINVNSLGVKSIKLADGTTALSGGEISDTRDIILRYDLGNDVFIIDSVNSFGDLSDIYLSGLSDGDILQYVASNSRWENKPAFNLPTDYITGLAIENDAGDTQHDIKINIGKARSKDDSVDCTISSALIKRIDANWAAGTNQGGFPSSITLSNSTWYHFFVIAKADGTTDAGFDSSITATNLLDGSNAGAAGYTKYRRVGSILTDGSANIVKFIQYENKFVWDSPKQSFSGAAPTGSSSNVTLQTPLGIKTEAILTIGWITEDSAAVNFYRVFENTLTDVAVSNSNADLFLGASAGVDGSVVKRVYTDTSSQVYHRAFASSGTNYILTQGYIDNRID